MSFFSSPPPALDNVTWFDANWMFVGPILAIIVMVRATLNIGKHSTSAANSRLLILAWAAMPVYAIHQFEEHAYDIYGNRYAFIDYFNNEVAPLGISLTPRVVTIVNVALVWFNFLASAAYAEVSGDFVPSAFCVGLALFNGVVAHALPALIMQRYNPGVVQSVTIMVPYAVFFFHALAAQFGRGRKLLILSLLFAGPIGHGLLLIFPVKLHSMGMLGEAGLAAWMCLGMLPFMTVASAHMAKMKVKE